MSTQSEASLEDKLIDIKRNGRSNKEIKKKYCDELVIDAPIFLIYLKS